MFYFNDTHFIYGYMVCWTYGKRPLSDGERGNPLPTVNRLLFAVSSKGSFIGTV